MKGNAYPKHYQMAHSKDITADTVCGLMAVFDCYGDDIPAEELGHEWVRPEVSAYAGLTLKCYRHRDYPDVRESNIAYEDIQKFIRAKRPAVNMLAGIDKNDRSRVMVSCVPLKNGKYEVLGTAYDTSSETALLGVLNVLSDVVDCF